MKFGMVEAAHGEDDEERGGDEGGIDLLNAA